MSAIGCYTLHLYCDGDAENHRGWVYATVADRPFIYNAETGAECRQKARKEGWKLCLDGRAYCPKCNRKVGEAPAPEEK